MRGYFHLDCGLPNMTEGKTINVSKDKLWDKGLKAIGEVPSDVEGKQLYLPDYPQYLPWITASGCNIIKFFMLMI